MQIEERYCLERYNFKFNKEIEKYQLPFDRSELTLYDFYESPYLGRDNICYKKESSLNSEKIMPIQKEKAEELLKSLNLQLEYEYDFSNEIIKLIKLTLTYGVVII